LARRDWPRKRKRMIPRRRMEAEKIMNLKDATKRAETFARATWRQAAVTDNYEDADFYVVRGVSPRGEWTVMFDKRTGKRLVPP